eukprot:10245177-Heterocapsa_arctica.AAC.1
MRKRRGKPIARGCDDMVFWHFPALTGPGKNPQNVIVGVLRAWMRAAAITRANFQLWEVETHSADT